MKTPEQSQKSILEKYQQAVEHSKIPVDQEKIKNHIEKIRESLLGIVYGPYQAYFLTEATESLKHGENPKNVFDAIRAATMLFGRSGRDYEKNIPNLGGIDWETLQSKVMAGIIDVNFLPDNAIAPEGFGTRQVRNANRVFNASPSRAQLLLAQWNYNLFNNSTMLEGSRLLGQEGVGSLVQWTEQSEQESMPHLTLSNMAIGSSVSDILSSNELQNQKVTIVDTGSGTGATLAAVTLGIEQVKNMNNSIALKGIEACQALFEKLQSDFLPLLEQRTSNVEAEIVLGDILSEMEELPKQEGFAIITANYVWHWLPSQYKQQLIKIISEKWENVIFLIGDLEKNESLVNRRYFDVAINGPLNTGNIGLQDLFLKNDYGINNLNVHFHSPSTADWLAKRIGQGTTADSLFYIAGKGEIAERILQTWRQDPIES